MSRSERWLYLDELNNNFPNKLHLLLMLHLAKCELRSDDCSTCSWLYDLTENF